MTDSNKLVMTFETSVYEFDFWSGRDTDHTTLTARFDNVDGLSPQTIVMSHGERLKVTVERL